MIPHLKINDNKDIKNKDKIYSYKKRSLELNNERIAHYSKKYLGPRFSSQSTKSNKYQINNAHNITNNFRKQRNSNISNKRFIKPRLSNQSFKYQNKIISNHKRRSALNNKNNDLQKDNNSSFYSSEIDYKEIEEEIQNAILEMKQNYLFEIKRQSYNEIEAYRKKILKEKLNEEITNSKTIDNNLKTEEQNDKLNNNNENDIKIKNILKKNNSINDGNVDGEILNQNIIIKSKFDLPQLNYNRNKSYKEKFRFYGRGGIIEDSLDENESDEEYEIEDGFLINPETTTFFIYDMIIAFSALYCLIFCPYEIMNICFCDNNLNRYNFYINYFIDILFIIDVIVNFFLQYYDKKEKLVKNRKKIFEYYIKGCFFFDFLTSLPFNLIYYYYCKYNYPIVICHTYEKNISIYYLALLKCLKAFKIFKLSMNKKNYCITKIIESASDKPSISTKMDLLIDILLVVFGLHIISCIHIFIAKNIYPSWIFTNKFQNYSLSELYIISLYYIIQTMTTVGYGDISSETYVEIIFRIFLLAVGIICYSWIISNISNGINKKSYASIQFSNDCILLENIRKENEELPFQVYSRIKNYLEKKHFRQNIYNKKLLINSLPYSLKNNLIFSMYKYEIKNFNFFKGISNTNFISEVLYNLSSIICKKNEILLYENQIIEEIILVKDGQLSLELPIDLDNLETSINQYLSNKFMKFAFSFEYEDNFQISETNISQHSISSLLKEKEENSTFFIKSFKLFKDNNNIEGNNLEKSKLFYLKIYDIHKDEDYGGIYMFHGKRSPFAVKVRSKRAKLYTIKSDDFADLCESYKNIINRKQKKEKKYLKIIKNILIKTIDKFCNINGIKIYDQYKTIIDKALFEINEKFVPDILKNTSIARSILNNEFETKIDKNLKEFSEYHKLNTLSESQTLSKNTTDQKDKNINIIPKGKILSKLIKDNNSSLNNKKIRNKKKSLKLCKHGNLGVGINVIQGFSNQYLDNFNTSKESNFINKNPLGELINLKLKKNKNKNKKQNKIKNEISKNKINNNDNNNNNNINLKEIELDGNESEKSNKTFKLEEFKKDGGDLWPTTLNSLPIELKTKIETKIINKKETNFKIDHIYIEIINNEFTNLKKENKIRKNSFINNNSTTNETNIISNNNNSPHILNKYKRSKTEKRKNLKDKISKQKQFLCSKNLSLSKNNTNILNFSQKNISYVNSPINKGQNNNSPIKFRNRKSISLNTTSKFSQYLNKDKNNTILEYISSTSAESFEIKRSYKNLNQISGGSYIKNKKLQKKIIKIIQENDDHLKKDSIKVRKRRLSVDFEIKKLFTKNKEKKGFKKIENSIKNAKRRLSDIILKKKREKKILKKMDISLVKEKKSTEHNNNKPYLNKTSNNKNSTKKLSINSYNNDLDNSIVQLKSLSINPDESIDKLNCSNREIIFSNINEKQNDNDIL